MERKSSEARIRANMKYNAKNVIRKVLNFNKNTDADILEYLESVPNFQGYIKDLIRKDMN